MQQTPDQSDVIVIGGGPAGSTAAALLARHGHRVTLFEKESFPRDHVGESLLPFCYRIFQRLGVLPELERRFVRKPGVRFVDSDGTTYTTWCFAHVIRDESYLSFHVLRAEFDHILLENAARAGVSVHQGTRVREVDLEGEGGWVCVGTRRPDGAEARHRARFLVDASGRDTFLASRHGWKQPHAFLDRTALSTHWSGGRYAGGIEEGLLQIVHLAGEKQGWIWMIPVGRDRISAGVVLNHAYIKQRKSELLASGVEDWPLALYRAELDSSPFVRETLAQARILMPLMLNGNYSYQVTRKYGENFAMVGDSGCFIDPIFASGVYLSMQSAELAADAIHERLTSGAGDALEEAYEKINGAYRLVDRAIRLFYNPRALNFAQMGGAAPVLHQHAETAIAVGHYLLAGDFFANHQKYYDFLETLENPKVLEKYRAFVIDRKEFQSTSCGLDRSRIFHTLLEEQGAA